MPRSFNQGLVTSSKGTEIETVNIAIGATGAVGAIEDFNANLFASVVRVSAGLYRFTLNTPFPGLPAGVNVHAQVEQVNAPNPHIKAFKVRGSYNAATGVFDVQCTNSATPAVATDPASGDVLVLQIAMQRYKNI